MSLILNLVLFTCDNWINCIEKHLRLILQKNTTNANVKLLKYHCYFSDGMGDEFLEYYLIFLLYFFSEFLRRSKAAVLIWKVIALLKLNGKWPNFMQFQKDEQIEKQTKLEAIISLMEKKKRGKNARKLECTSVFFSLWFLNTNVRQPSADRKACVLPDLCHSYELSNHWHIVPFFIDIFIPIFWSLWFFFSFIQSLLGLTPPKIIHNWCSSLK